MRHDDQTLVAYLDGQLDEQQCDEIEAALAHDPDLRARLDALARASELAQRSLEPVLQEPLPPEMIDAIWRAPDPRERAAHAPAHRPGWRERWREWMSPAPRFALASTVLVLGVGWMLLRTGGGPLEAGDTVDDGALALVLDTATTGETLRTRQSSLEMLGSFVAADGSACRAFQHRQGSDDTLAVACRDQAGEAWRVAFAQTGPADETGGYAPAGDERAEAAENFLRDTLRATPLTPGEERGFIARGWDR